jgi:hypothetical protein
VALHLHYYLLADILSGIGQELVEHDPIDAPLLDALRVAANTLAATPTARPIDLGQSGRCFALPCCYIALCSLRPCEGLLDCPAHITPRAAPNSWSSTGIGRF